MQRALAVDEFFKSVEDPNHVILGDVAEILYKANLTIGFALPVQKTVRPIIREAVQLHRNSDFSKKSLLNNVHQLIQSYIKISKRNIRTNHDTNSAIALHEFYSSLYDEKYEIAAESIALLKTNLHSLVWAQNKVQPLIREAFEHAEKSESSLQKAEGEGETNA